jgi:hypothetical protein
LLEYLNIETRTFVLFLVLHQIDLEDTSTRVDIYFSKKFQTRRCYDFCQVDLSIGQDYRKSLGVSDLLRNNENMFFLGDSGILFSAIPYGRKKNPEYGPYVACPPLIWTYRNNGWILLKLLGGEYYKSN